MLNSPARAPVPDFESALGCQGIYTTSGDVSCREPLLMFDSISADYQIMLKKHSMLDLPFP
jgi:hypothetical protein